jgi:hypothetical protein
VETRKHALNFSVVLCGICIGVTFDNLDSAVVLNAFSALNSPVAEVQMPEPNSTDLIQRMSSEVGELKKFSSQAEFQKFYSDTKLKSIYPGNGNLIRTQNEISAGLNFASTLTETQTVGYTSSIFKDENLYVLRSPYMVEENLDEATSIFLNKEAFRNFPNVYAIAVEFDAKPRVLIITKANLNFNLLSVEESDIFLENPN